MDLGLVRSRNFSHSELNVQVISQLTNPVHGSLNNIFIETIFFGKLIKIRKKVNIYEKTFYDASSLISETVKFVEVIFGNKIFRKQICFKCVLFKKDIIGADGFKI